MVLVVMHLHGRFVDVRLECVVVVWKVGYLVGHFSSPLLAIAGFYQRRTLRSLRVSDWTGRRLHFIGIGGAGMSGLALVAQALGASVTGSDRAASSYSERLAAAGISPVIGHAAANVPAGAEIVISTAISSDNPELIEGATV